MSDVFDVFDDLEGIDDDEEVPAIVIVDEPVVIRDVPMTLDEAYDTILIANEQRDQKVKRDILRDARVNTDPNDWTAAILRAFGRVCVLRRTPAKVDA